MIVKPATALLAAILTTGCASQANQAQQARIQAEMTRLQTACERGSPNACELYRIKANALMQASAQNQAARQYTGRALQRAGRDMMRCGAAGTC